jgi:hypothetical protein
MNNNNCPFYNIGCDFHTRFQQLTYKDKETGDLKQIKLSHEGDAVRNFYASLAKDARVRVGIESTG